jgi:phosphatidylinositol alpha-1,6-mannosyltransferase
VVCYGAEITLPAAFPITRSLLRRPLREADALFAISHFTQRKVAALTGREVVYIGAGIEVDAFTPATEAPSGVPLVGCVSRFVPRKGQARVIRAVAELRRRGVDAEVLLVGKGRLERRLRRLAVRLGVPTRFEVGVPWSALPGLYREMTVFVMPVRSRWLGLEVEGLGLVFLEAASAGLPVLAGDSGGSPETVDPGVTGYVVRRHDDIVDGIRRLLGDPPRAREMGRMGRLRVVEGFTWEATAGRLLEGLSVAGQGPSEEPGS